MPVKVLPIGPSDIAPSTRVHRYLSTKSFDRLLTDGIGFTRISTWPDRMERADFSFAANASKLKDKRSKTSFFASCWSLERESRDSFNSDRSHEMAQDELLRDGSASMWETYCRFGGVRISTTIDKLDCLIEHSTLADETVFRAGVMYCAKDDPQRVLGKKHLEETLFYKRTGYRHEAEYRYVTYKAFTPADHINLQIENISDFLDEVLVFPLKNNKCDALANALHTKGVRIATRPELRVNTKDGRPFCRVSQLYGLVSQSLGNVRFVCGT